MNSDIAIIKLSRDTTEYRNKCKEGIIKNNI